MKKLAVAIAMLGLTMGCGKSDSTYVSYDLRREMTLSYNGKLIVVDLTDAETQYVNQNIPVKINVKIEVSSGEKCNFDVYLQEKSSSEYILTFVSSIYQNQCDPLEKSYKLQLSGDGQGALSDDVQ